MGKPRYNKVDSKKIKEKLKIHFRGFPDDFLSSISESNKQKILNWIEKYDNIKIKKEKNDRNNKVNENEENFCNKFDEFKTDIFQGFESKEPLDPFIEKYRIPYVNRKHSYSDPEHEKDIEEYGNEDNLYSSDEENDTSKNEKENTDEPITSSETEPKKKVSVTDILSIKSQLSKFEFAALYYWTYGKGIEQIDDGIRDAYNATKKKEKYLSAIQRRILPKKYKKFINYLSSADRTSVLLWVKSKYSFGVTSTFIEILKEEHFPNTLKFLSVLRNFSQQGRYILFRKALISKTTS